MGILAPDIRDTFGISNGVITFITAASSAFLVLGALPMGVLADRCKRSRVVGFASLAFAVFPTRQANSPVVCAGDAGLTRDECTDARSSTPQLIDSGSMPRVHHDDPNCANAHAQQQWRKRQTAAKGSAR